MDDELPNPLRPTAAPGPEKPAPPPEEVLQKKLSETLAELENSRKGRESDRNFYQAQATALQGKLEEEKSFVSFLSQFLRWLVALTFAVEGGYLVVFQTIRLKSVPGDLISLAYWAGGCAILLLVAYWARTERKSQ